MTFKTTTTRHTGRNALLLSVLVVLFAFLIAGMPGWGADTQPGPAAQGKIPFPRPDSHKGNWLEFHGRTVPLSVIVNGPGQAGNSCYACHEKADCIMCHNTQMPRDHNNFWRIRGHGLQASGNRERCLACHKQDYCIRCHNETAPPTHTAGWVKRHCSWCHFDRGAVPAGNCGVCHKVAPHTSAPSIPPHPPISAQTTCIQLGCHH